LVDVPDEAVPSQHVMVWMLIRGERSVLLVIVRWLDERVVRQPPTVTIGDEVSVEAEILGPQKRHAKCSALGTEVVDLACLPGGLEPAIDPLPVAEPDQRGVDITERRSEMRELTVGWGWPGHG